MHHRLVGFVLLVAFVWPRFSEAAHWPKSLLIWRDATEARPADCEVVLLDAGPHDQLTNAAGGPQLDMLFVATEPRRPSRDQRGSDQRPDRIARLIRHPSSTSFGPLEAFAFGTDLSVSPDGTRLLVTVAGRRFQLWDDLAAKSLPAMSQAVQPRVFSTPRWFGPEAILLHGMGGLYRFDLRNDRLIRVPIDDSIDSYHTAALSTRRLAIFRAHHARTSPEATYQPPAIFLLDLPPELPVGWSDEDFASQAEPDTVWKRMPSVEPKKTLLVDADAFNGQMPPGHRAAFFVTLRAAYGSEDLFLTCIEEASNGKLETLEGYPGEATIYRAPRLAESVWRVRPGERPQCLLRGPYGHYLRLKAAAADGSSLLLTAFLGRLPSGDGPTTSVPLTAESLLMPTGVHPLSE